MSAIKPTPTLIVLLLSLAAGCGGGEPTVGVQLPVRQIRGQIVEVVSRNIAEIELFTIRDENGLEYTFTTDGFVEFTPSHLKEHQLFGQAVLVSYVKQEGRLVAVKIGD
jgi:hypothetical protein